MQQGWIARALAVLTASVVALTGLVAPQLVAPSAPAVAAEENGYVINEPWQLVNPGSATTANTPGVHRTAATMRATSQLQTRSGPIGVTATMAAPGQVAGTNILTNPNSQGWGGHGATPGMFLGAPTPTNVPGLGVLTNASTCDGPLGSAGHQNFNGLCPSTTTVTLAFDRAVTDPVLDLGGIGGWGYYGWTTADGVEYAKGSFNSQEWVITTPGVTMTLAGDAPTNLVVDRGRLRTIADNTSGSCGVAEKAAAGTRCESPNMALAGCGSVQLHGTFTEVSFEMDTFISRFSGWPTSTHRTGANYFRDDRDIFADGQNGLNVVWGERLRLPTGPTDGEQSDYSILSVRLPQNAELGDRVWIDENENGLQDLGETGVAGITVELLDGAGQPVLASDGTPITTTTDASGDYLFGELAYGEYRVRFSGIPNGWFFTARGAGDPESSSAVDPSNGLTDPIRLDAATPRNLDQDAGLIRRDPGFELTKAAEPSTGTRVEPGRTISYTLVGENTGELPLDPVRLTDELAQVLDHATLTVQPTADIDGEPAAAPTLSGTELRWTGVLQPGQRVTVRYTVTVDQDAAGATIRNDASASATPVGGSPIVPEGVSTSHPVPEPGFELGKSAAPASGTAVHPGEEVRYTITGTNTGETRLDPVTVTDELAGVLDDAVIVDGPTATIGGEPATAPTVDGTVLRWSGVLDPDEIVTIAYTVRVDQGTEGRRLENRADGRAAPPAGPVIESPESTTTHPIPTPGFQLRKDTMVASFGDLFTAGLRAAADAAASPFAARTADPGDRVEYQLTGTNTGGTVLDPVTITDDLSDVLDDGTIVAGPVAWIGSVRASDPVIDGTTLRWSGRLEPDQLVRITYTVLVDADAGGGVLRNTATGVAQPPGSEPIRQEDAVETPIRSASLDFEKRSAPADGATVHPGDEIAYTLVAENTGDAPLDPVTVTDDLAGVLEHASLTGSPTATIDGTATTDPVLDGTTLRWTGALNAGQRVTIEYTVTVHDDASGVTMTNVADATATPPSGFPPIETGEQSTSHPVPASGFVFAKSADPASGSTVAPGSEITYTVTGRNTGATLLDPVEISDDLSDVLAASSLVGSPSARIDGAPTAEPTLTGTRLAWSGALPAGAAVTVEYTVRVDDDAAGASIANHARATAQPPGSAPPIVASEVETTHEVPRPGFDLAKSATPPSGSTVDPGQTVTYVVTGTNSGETPLDVELRDELAEILEHAALTSGPTASIDGNPAPAPTLTGTVLEWNGELQPDQVVRLEYTVTVNQDAAGAELGNVVTGTGQPPGTGPAIDPGRRETSHAVPVPGFELSKSADPVSGTEVHPGGTITYTLSGENTGQTRLDPVELVDELAEVLSSASLSGTPSASIDGTATTDPTIDGTRLRWTGTLDPGQTVTVRYTVTVGADAAGAMLENRASGTAAPPGGPVLTAPEVQTFHPVPEPALELRKRATPDSGTTVRPGDEIAYTVSAENTGETVLDPTTVVDDLGEVLNDATLSGTPSAEIDGTPAAAPSLDGTELRWTGRLERGQTVTLRYTVVVDPDAAGTTLRNSVTASAQPPGTGAPITQGPRRTTHEVPTPAYEFTKTADPATGTTVNPGDDIDYLLTGRNTGETPLDPVTVTDELAEVLANAGITGDPVATIDGEPAAMPVVEGTTLRWTGSLRPGQTVAIRYTVTVHDDAAGATLRNTARSTAQPPGTGPALAPPQQQTTHPVPVPGFALTKTAEPASGATVNPGERVSYTVVGRNTGATPLDPVTIADELAGVLDHAELVAAPTATIDGEPAPAPVLDGSTLRWTGALSIGQAVTLSYTVTVADDAAGERLRNVATGAAQPPGTGPALDGGRHETVHAVPVPGFSLAKSADPAPGSTVYPGQSIEYALTGTNTGETVLDPVEIRDELAGVLAHAALRGAATASIDGSPAATPTLDGTVLRWSGALRPDETVTIRYTVVVDESAAGVTLRNSASGTATPPGGPVLEAPEVATTHEVPVSGYRFEKTASPADGSVVARGEQLRYTLSGVNTGETRLDPVEIRDELAGVLANAALAAAPEATIDGAPAPAPVVDGELLRWSGALEPGQRVEITYTVTVSDEAAGRLRNTATSTATPPGGPRIESGERSTSHPIPAIELAKRAELAGSGIAGDVIDYTFTITNTGGTRLDDVVLRDPLPGLSELRFAWPDPGAPGVLEIGQTATASASYTLTQADVDAGSVRNTATVTGTPPGDGTPLVTDEDGTSTPAEQRAAIALEKTGRASGDRAGELVEFRFLVTNTGTVTLRDVAIDDPLPGLSALRFVWPDASAPGVLAPGDSATATANYRLTAADVERGRVHNVASATGTPPGSLTPPRASDDATVAVGGLPATGVSLGAGVLAAFLLAAGALLLPLRRRRSVRRSEE